MRKIMLCFLIIEFMIVGCGEDEPSISELSQQILGCWQCQDKEMTPTMIYPVGDSFLTLTASWTLTFYRTGRFDSILQARMTMDSPEPFTIKCLTEGDYEAFESCIVFRPRGPSQVSSSNAEFQSFIESDPSLEGLMAEGQNAMTGTSTASVSGNTLYLDGKVWTRI